MLDNAVPWLFTMGLFNLVVGVPLAWLAAGILKRPKAESLVLGFLMGPIGWILIGFLEPYAVGKCPACRAGLQDGEATRCRHCGADVYTEAHK